MHFVDTGGWKPLKPHDALLDDKVLIVAAENMRNSCSISTHYFKLHSIGGGYEKEGRGKGKENHRNLHVLLV